MDKRIKPEYAVIALAEVLFENHMINEPTLEAIRKRVQDEQSHISQEAEQSL